MPVACNQLALLGMQRLVVLRDDWKLWSRYAPTVCITLSPSTTSKESRKRGAPPPAALPAYDPNAPRPAAPRPNHCAVEFGGGPVVVPVPVVVPPICEPT